MKTIKNLWPVLAFILIFAISLRNLWSYGMLAYGDATPFPNNFKEAFQFFWNAFDPRMPGVMMPQASVILSTLVPLEAALALFLGGSFLWAQKIFYFLPIPLSFVTIYFLVSKITPSRPARFVTAFIYGSNHFMVGEFAGGFAGNLYIPALFPLLIFFLFRLGQSLTRSTPLSVNPEPVEGLTKGAKRDIIKCSLVYSGLLAIAYVLSDHVLFLLVPFWIIFILRPFFLKDPPFQSFKKIVFNTLILFITLLLALSLTAYHAYGYLKIALPFLSGATLNKDLIPFFIQNLWDTYWKMTPGNVLRLGGSYFIDFYQGNQIWARLGFIIPLLAFSWFIFSTNRRGFRLKIGLLLSVFGLFTAAFIYLTGQGVTHPLFTAVPALFRFRNPSRLSLFLAFLYSPLIALTLDGWFNFLSNLWSKGKRLILFPLLLITSLLVISLVYYHKGFFSGDFTLKQHRGESFYISDRYDRLSKFLNKEHQKKGIFRTAFFPWNHEDAEMKLFWLEPYALGVPIEYGAYSQNEYLDFIKEVFQRVESDRMKNFGDLLNSGGVKYVVLNSNLKQMGKATYEYTYHVPWLLGSYDDLSRIISSAGDLKLIDDVAGFKVFENTKFDPLKINSRQAGLFTENLARENYLRQFLIFWTGSSWAVLALVLKKIL